MDKKRKVELQVIVGCNSNGITKELKRIIRELDKVDISIKRMEKSTRSLSKRKIEVNIGQYRKDLSILKIIGDKIKSKLTK